MKKPNKAALRKRLPKRRSACPISYSLDFIGDKWTLLVVRDLVFSNKRHYGEFLKSGEAIASNILADRLLKLEAGGIVRKLPDPDNGVRYVYTLTDKGLDLIPVMLELAAWGAAHDPKTGAPKAFMRRFREDREGLIEEIRKSHVKA
jgi:DNA-binding HxlR family transcriptional regulator